MTVDEPQELGGSTALMAGDTGRTKSAMPERDLVYDPFRTIVGWAVIVLAVLAVLASLAIAEVFIIPVLMAFLLALVFGPLCHWLRRRGIPEPVSALIVVLALLAGLSITTVTLALPVTGWLEDAPTIAREAERKLRALTGYAEAVSEASRQLEEATDTTDEVRDALVEVVIAEEGPLTTVALGAPMIVAQTIFTLILMFFVLASGILFYERLVGIMPTLTKKKKALKIAYDIERDVSRTLLAITAINAGLGLTIGLAMFMLGMPSPLAFGLMAFALNYVPFLGAIAGVGISFAVAFRAWLWSIMGMIMAVPLLVCFRVFCKLVRPLRPLGE